MYKAHPQGVLAVCVLLLGAVCAGAQDWPQWRGPNRDNKVTGFTAPATWPKELTKKWRVTVGVGESSPLLVGDKVYAFGRQGGDEVTWCLNAATGKEVWQDRYAAVTVTGAASGYPGPRSTPAVAEGHICTLGVGGVVSCLDAATGKIVWRKDTKSRPQFYTSTSPLIVDGKCLVFVGGLTAYALDGGEQKWQWSDAGTPYGSPALMTVEGTKTVVTPALGTLAGIRLSDGKALWQTKIGAGGDYQSNYSTPIIDGNVVIYSVAVKGGKGGGGGGGNIMALKIEKKGDGFTATELWKKGPAADKYHTPVLKDGLLFGVTSGARNFFCVDVKTGEQLWTDKTQRGQCGCILDTGSVFLASTGDRDLIAFQPSNKKYAELAKYRIDESWCVPIVAGNRVFVKDKGGALTLWTLE